MATQWRRQYERISCYIPILFRFIESNPKDGWGVIHDISLGGIKAETRTVVKEGQTVYISFSISEEFNFVNAKCLIQRTVQDGIYYICGIKFTDSIDKQHLHNALQLHLLTTDVESAGEKKQEEQHI
jgi:hypothetical protein